MNNEILIDLGAVSKETLGVTDALYLESQAPFECQDLVVTIPGCP